MQKKKPQLRTSSANFQRQKKLPPQKSTQNRNLPKLMNIKVTSVKDARDRIINNKKSGVGDARNKIVNLQVKKGTFDARSILQRQNKGTRQTNGQAKNSAGVPQGVTRTLSNPGARRRGRVQATATGLLVTRPVPSTQVSFTGNSLQVTKRNNPTSERKAPVSIADAVPIIQIRNDRYKTPSSYDQILQDTNSYSTYEEYSDEYHEEATSHTSSTYKGYRDWDNPVNNPSAIDIPQVPKAHASSIKTVAAAGMRPVSASTTRVPPGASSRPAARKPPTAAEPAKAPVRMSTAGLKRRAPPAAAEEAGPLRLGRGGGPGIDLTTPSPPKRGKPSHHAPPEVIDLEEESDFISPIQGFRVVVTNLFSGVTQDDIIELFGAVGSLKKAKLLKPGSAEVVYITKDNAISAVQKYHGRELDGQPMYVKMTTPVEAVIKTVKENDPDITGEALRLYKKPSSLGSLPHAPVETPTLHRALFKVGPPGPNKSVKFTVKI